MCEDYDENIAFHYNAYRPALHAQILSSVLGEKRFERGLDVGCGTGQSSIALASFCKRVIGIEPSEAMLSKVISHPDVTYLKYHGENFPLEDGLFDIITFAGSLYYGKSQALLNDVKRVSRSAATILIYDFDVVLNEILKTFKTNIPDVSMTGYNHEVDFSGLENIDFELLNKQQEITKIRIKTKDLSHLILADKGQYRQLEELFGSQNLYQSVLNHLFEISENGYFNITAKLYYTQYACLKS